MINPNNLKIKRISFSAIVDYWIEVDHFQVKDKKYLETVNYLGHLKREVSNPKYICYGLYGGEELIGVTHISEWSSEWIRYRTINIRKSYRGHGLGWQLLKSCILKDWSTYKIVFGWVRKEHTAWSLDNGFSYHDKIWEDNHTAMTASIAHLSEKVKLIGFSE